MGDYSISNQQMRYCTTANNGCDTSSATHSWWYPQEVFIMPCR
jgi:hypothetical protein